MACTQGWLRIDLKIPRLHEQGGQDEDSGSEVYLVLFFLLQGS